jgi:biopolymer transport protein ExbB
MNLSLIELFRSMGGFAKGIVYVLAIMSLYSLTIMLQKWWYLRAAQEETRKFAPEFSQFLEEDNQAADPGRLGDGRRHQLGGTRGRA